MSRTTNESTLLPYIEIPNDLLNAFKGGISVLLIGKIGSGKTHVLRRLLTLGAASMAGRTVYDADLRGNSICKEVAEVAKHSPVVACMQAVGALEAWDAFSRDAGISIDDAKAAFPLVVVVDHGKVLDQITV